MAKNNFIGYESTSIPKPDEKSKLQGEKVNYKADGIKVTGNPFGGYTKDTRAEASGNDIKQIGQKNIVDLSNNTKSSMGKIQK